MFPILTRTEQGFIYTFTVLWGVGIGAAILYLWWQTKPHQRWWPDWFDGILAIGLFAILMGRFQFVIQNGEYFAENPTERWGIADGGIGYWGVLIGVIIGCLIFSIIRPAAWRQVWPTAGLILVWLHLVGWTACYFDGCAFGGEVDLAWYAADLPDTFGVYAVRIQTQLIGVLIYGLAFLGLGFAPSRHSFWLWVVVAALQLLLIPLRGEDMPLLLGDGIRFDFVVGVFVCAILMLVAIFFRPSGES